MSIHISQLLAQRAALLPDHEALVAPNGRWSYAQFDQRCDRLASHLVASGVKEGDRVAILAKNGEFAATSVFAIARAGGIAVVLNWRLQAAELSYILDDCAPKAVLFEATFGETVVRLRGHCSASGYVCHATSEDRFGAHDYEQIVTTASDVPMQPRGHGGTTPAVIMYTSGTTGRPKGAVLSHEALFWAAHGNSCTLPWNQDHRYLLVTPMFHIGGLSPLFTNVLKGCTSVLAADFDPVEVWQIIARERITNMMAVPLMLQTMLAVARKMPIDASSLVCVGCGASAVPTPLIESFQQLGVAVSQVYGATEFCGSVSYWMPGMGLDKAGSQGRAVMFGELAVVDPQTHVRLASGDKGEIWCRGPMAFSGYWGNAHATHEAFHEGWYRTGDIGYLDAGGFLHVVDRLKDMIISGGENIYPAELEATISQHPAVSEVAVIGRPDETWGEVPVACIVGKPGESLSEAQVIAWCRERLAGFKCVKEVRFLQALPRNAVGKVLKAQLRS